MTELCHQRLGHLNYKNLSNLDKKKRIDGLPKLESIDNTVRGPCQLGKQLRVHHKLTTDILTNKPFELLHIDLMGQSRTESLGDKRYILVVVNDFPRYTLLWDS